MRIFLIEHSSGQVYEPIYTRIEKAFFCQESAKEYVQNKTDEYDRMCKEHDLLYDTHVENCTLEEESDDEDYECPICSKWYDMNLKRYDNHSWETVDVEVE